VLLRKMQLPVAVIRIPFPPLPLSSCVHNLLNFVITPTRFVVRVFSICMEEGNDPSWPLNMNELPKYRLSFREVFVDAQDGGSN